MSLLSTLSFEAAAHRQALRQQILTLSAGQPVRESFSLLALAVFRYQAAYNPIYTAYIRYLNILPEKVTDIRQIPFMPIGFFKTHTILTGTDTALKPDQPDSTLTFASSGTTDRSVGPVVTSRHLVADPALYDAVSTRIFEQTYGPLRNFHILALLPSYLERNNSSLVYMVQRFMEQTNSNHAGFFLHNHIELTERLRQLSQQPDQKRILLIGVTFGLLDWAESAADLSFLSQLPDLIVMETGGMKGRRKELLREEVHKILTDRLGVSSVHSEYGMTELLSQAYSAGEGVFSPSSTLRVLLRDINDPFFIYPDDSSQTGSRQTGGSQTGSRQTGSRQTGGINVIDLANLDSCSFIETQDLGQYVDDEGGYEPGSFRVIGRFDNSDVRGCNLLVIN